MTPPHPNLPTKLERRLAAGLFNYTWTLIGKKRRTPEDDELMVNAAHASMYHWTAVKGGMPAVGWWQVSHVYSLLGRAGPAHHYALLSLRHCLRHRLGGFQLAYAYEALARAALAAKNEKGARQYLRRALAAGDRIEEDDDRAQFLRDMRQFPSIRRLAPVWLQEHRD